MHIINKYFDKVICISLINKDSRREHIKRQMDVLGIEFEFFDAIPYGILKTIFPVLKESFKIKFPNEIGVTLSHYAVIKMAEVRGYKSVLIIEDDALFLKNFNEEVVGYLKMLPKDWDIFYLTYSLNAKFLKYNEDLKKLIENDNKGIYKPRKGWWSTCYAINSSAYKKVLDFIDSDLLVIDFYYHKLQDMDELNFYACYPSLTSQELESDIRPTKDRPVDFYEQYGTTFGKNKMCDYFEPYEEYIR